jgi:hypothetical protein
MFTAEPNVALIVRAKFAALILISPPEATLQRHKKGSE